jgi:hypothetical protein
MTVYHEVLPTLPGINGAKIALGANPESATPSKGSNAWDTGQEPAANQISRPVTRRECRLRTWKIGEGCGGSHTCALLADGSVKCWGGNSTGQLGDCSLPARTTPVSPQPVEGAVRLDAGRSSGSWGTTRPRIVITRYGLRTCGTGHRLHLASFTAVRCAPMAR